MEKDCDRGSPDCVAAVALEGASEPKLVLAASAEPMKRTIKKGRARAVLSSSYVLLITQTPVSPTTSRAMKIPERTSFLI
jgi:hypothetical protein